MLEEVFSIMFTTFTLGHNNIKKQLLLGMNMRQLEQINLSPLFPWILWIHKTASGKRCRPYWVLYSAWRKIPLYHATLIREVIERSFRASCKCTQIWPPCMHSNYQLNCQCYESDTLNNIYLTQQITSQQQLRSFSDASRFDSEVANQITCFASVSKV